MANKVAKRVIKDMAVNRNSPISFQIRLNSRQLKSPAVKLVLANSPEKMERQAKMILSKHKKAFRTLSLL